MGGGGIGNVGQSKGTESDGRSFFRRRLTVRRLRLPQTPPGERLNPVGDVAGGHFVVVVAAAESGRNRRVWRVSGRAGDDSCRAETRRQRGWLERGGEQTTPARFERSLPLS